MGAGGSDQADLQMQVVELQREIAQLKAGGPPAGGLDNQRSWLTTAPSSGFDRPTTASSQNRKIQDLQQQLQNEANNSKRMKNEIDRLNAEVRKKSMLGSAGTAFGAGRIAGVPGVSEIEYSELTFGDQLGQGGFSVIKKAAW